MSARVAVLGNCHAQYFAAAMTSSFPELDIRIVGKPFDGPIHFKGVQPTYIKSTELLDWLRKDDAANIIFRQTTPMADTKFQDRLEKLGLNFNLTLFPYIEFRALVIQRSNPNFGIPLIRSRMRADEISNKICLSKAGLDGAIYDEFLSHLREAPCSYTHNHFNGTLFHKILSSVDLNALGAVVGPDRLSEFLGEIRKDVGIPHAHSGIPVPEVCELMQLTWADEVARQARERANLSYEEFRQLDWSRGMSDEYVNFVSWRTLVHHGRYAKTGQATAIRKCLRMYRADRPYVVWCKNVADWFVLKGQPARAALLIAHRMVWDDTRGLLLRWSLDNLKVFESSPTAKAVFRQAAKTAPNSNARIVSDILEALG